MFWSWFTWALFSSITIYMYISLNTNHKFKLILICPPDTIWQSLIAVCYLQHKSKKSSPFEFPILLQLTSFLSKSLILTSLLSFCVPFELLYLLYHVVLDIIHHSLEPCFWNFIISISSLFILNTNLGYEYIRWAVSWRIGNDDFWKMGNVKFWRVYCTKFTAIEEKSMKNL